HATRAADSPCAFGEMRRVGDVGEYIFWASRDLDARNNGCHRLPPSGRRNIDDSASGGGLLFATGSRERGEGVAGARQPACATGSAPRPFHFHLPDERAPRPPARD